MARFPFTRAGAGAGRLGRVLALAVLAMAFHGARAASFDCSKAAGSRIEMAICASSYLSGLDDQLASAYAEALKKKDRKALRAGQLAWLRKRDRLCEQAARPGWCLIQLYLRRIALLTELSRLRAFPGLKLLRSTDAYRPKRLFGMRHGRFVFAQYAASGNADDVVALDPASGAAKIVAGEIHEPTYLDANGSLMALSHLGLQTFPLGIYDRKTGRLLRQKGLRMPILAGRIVGDRLVAVQPGEGLAFDIATLHVLSSTKLPAPIKARFLRDDLILVLTPYKALLYDANFKQVGELPAPARPPHAGVFCGIQYGGLAATRLVLVRNCGELVVYDLESRSIETVIPRRGISASVAVVGDVIVSLNTYQFRPGPEARLYDLRTGEELGGMELPMRRLASIPGGFIGFGRNTGLGFATMHFFALDEAAVRDLPRRIERLSRANQDLESAASRADVYAQIAALERAGVGGFVWRLNAGKPIDAAVAIVLRHYAELMAHTLTRVDEAAALLGALSARDPGDAGLISLLAKVKARAAWLERGEARALARQTSRPESLPAEANRHAPELTVRSDKDRVYVIRRDCGPAGRKPSLRLEAFERKSMRRVGAVAIAACGDPDFPRPGNVDLAQGHLIVSSPVAGYAIEEGGAPMLVVDARSLAVTRRRMNFRPSVIFHFGHDQALLCDCADSSCVRFDVAAWNRTGVAVAPPKDLPCPGNESEDEACYRCVPPPESTLVEGFGRLVALTGRYAVFEGNDPGDSEIHTLEMVPVTQGSSAPRTVGFRSEQFLGLTGDAESALVSVRENDTVYLKAARLDDGKLTTLLDFEPRYHGIPAIGYGANVFVGYGRDLYVYDTGRGRLSWLEKNFVDGAFRNNCCGLDLNEIWAFRIAGNRLLVDNFGHDRARSLDLQRFLAGIGRPDVDTDWTR